MSSLASGSNLLKSSICPVCSLPRILNGASFLLNNLNACIKHACLIAFGTALYPNCAVTFTFFTIVGSNRSELLVSNIAISVIGANSSPSTWFPASIGFKKKSVLITKTYLIF